MKKLLYNYIVDLKKKEIDRFERGKLIQHYLDLENTSIRQLSKELDISKSTIEDWLLINKLTKEEYQDLLDKGFTETDIYRTLREKKTRAKPHMNQLDIKLVKCKTLLYKYVNNLKKEDVSEDTRDLIQSLRNLLNRLEMKIDNKRGG